MVSNPGARTLDFGSSCWLIGISYCEKSSYIDKISDSETFWASVNPKVDKGMKERLADVSLRASWLASSNRRLFLHASRSIFHTLPDFHTSRSSLTFLDKSNTRDNRPRECGLIETRYC